MRDLALKIPNLNGTPAQITPPAGFKPSFIKLGSILSTSLDLVLSVVGILLFLMLFWGAFQYILAGGDKEKLGKARNRITYALVGFIIVIIAFSASQFIQNVLLTTGITPANGIQSIPTPTQ